MDIRIKKIKILLHTIPENNQSVTHYSIWSIKTVFGKPNFAIGQPALT